MVSNTAAQLCAATHRGLVLLVPRPLSVGFEPDVETRFAESQYTEKSIVRSVEDNETSRSPTTVAPDSESGGRASFEL